MNSTGVLSLSRITLVALSVVALVLVLGLDQSLVQFVDFAPIYADQATTRPPPIKVITPRIRPNRNYTLSRNGTRPANKNATLLETGPTNTTSPDLVGTVPVHVTHFFNTYAADPGSSTYHEMKIVQTSWHKAAAHARDQYGLVVEFIDTTAPGDFKMSPPWATRYELTRWIKDFQKGKVPTVGEPFETAIKHGKGEVFVYTNSDIGATIDFYKRIYDLAKRDPIGEVVQRDAIRKAAKYLSVCFLDRDALKLDGLISLHLRMCREDAKIHYMHSGGFVELWDEVVEDVGILAAKFWQDAASASVSWVRFKELMHRLLFEYKDRERTFFGTRCRNPAALQELLKDFNPQLPSAASLGRFKDTPFAGTITRVDVDFTITRAKQKAGHEALLEEILTALPKSGRRHPGNDCFVFTPKTSVPKGVTSLVHPPGVRPFGQWIARAFYNQGIPFRRITGTKNDPWTFHVGQGLWGQDSDGWRDRANEDETYLLFLAGLFDVRSNGSFTGMYESDLAPKLCRDSVTAWRSVFYCNSVPDGFCAGQTRYSCYYYANTELRDSYFYLKGCESIHSTRKGKVAKPVCDICNNFFAWNKIRNKRFECSKLPLGWCEGLGEGACDFPA